MSLPAPSLPVSSFTPAPDLSAALASSSKNLLAPQRTARSHSYELFWLCISPPPRHLHRVKLEARAGCYVFAYLSDQKQDADKFHYRFAVYYNLNLISVYSLSLVLIIASKIWYASFPTAPTNHITRAPLAPPSASAALWAHENLAARVFRSINHLWITWFLIRTTLNTRLKIIFYQKTLLRKFFQILLTLVWVCGLIAIVANGVLELINGTDNSAWSFFYCRSCPGMLLLLPPLHTCCWKWERGSLTLHK